MATYDIQGIEPARVLTALHDHAFVNGYAADGCPVPDNLRSASLPLSQAREILAQPESAGPLVEARSTGSTVEITSINARWMYLSFAGDELRTQHQPCGSSAGPELYSEHFGVQVQTLLDDLRRDF